jgi:protein Mpv17
LLRDTPLKLLQAYDAEVLEFPLLTKAATSGVCYAIGDLCAQGFGGKDIHEWDLSRAGRSAAAGFIGHGPLRHYWLDFLDKSLTFQGAWWALMPKVALDQSAMAVVENTIYGLLMGAFAFKDPGVIARDIKATMVPQFAASIRFWPAVDLVTFSMIPVELQVLWEDVAEIIWICILQDVSKNVSIMAAEPKVMMPQLQPIHIPVEDAAASDINKTPSRG